MESKRHKTKDDNKEDRFSALPDELIHHILSFIPITLVVQMSLVSKRWRYMWTSIPALRFDCTDQTSFEDTLFGQPRFCKFVSNFLRCQKKINKKLFHNSNLPLSSFSLKIRCYAKNRKPLNRWLSFLAANQTSKHEFDLWILPKQRGAWFKWNDYLPETICNSKSLTSLRLSCMVLTDSFHLNLPSLKKLSLFQVSVNEDFFHNLVLGCPSLEILSVQHCEELLNLRISCSNNNLKVLTDSFLLNLPSLKKLSLFQVSVNDDLFHNLVLRCPSLEILSVQHCEGLLNLRISCSNNNLKVLYLKNTSMVTIHVEASNLQSFTYELEIKKGSKFSVTQNIDLSACRSLVDLSLLNVRLNGKCLEDLFCGLPVLQRLKLACCPCRELQHIKILSQQLRSFVLNIHKSHFKLAEFKIDAPNLVSFSYEGPMLSNVLIIKNPQLLSDVELIFYDQLKFDKNWYHYLINFLQNLNCYGSLSLEVSSAEDLNISQQLRNMCKCPFPNLKQLKVKPAISCESIRSALHWCAPSAIIMPRE